MCSDICWPHSDGSRRETIHPQFSPLIIRERADRPLVTCFGIVAFPASGTACGAVRAHMAVRQQEDAQGR